MRAGVRVIARPPVGVAPACVAERKPGAGAEADRMD